MNLHCQEIKRRGLKVAVVGIPKTIDNDISVCPRSNDSEKHLSGIICFYVRIKLSYRVLGDR